MARQQIAVPLFVSTLAICNRLRFGSSFSPALRIISSGRLAARGRRRPCSPPNLLSAGTAVAGDGEIISSRVTKAKSRRSNFLTRRFRSRFKQSIRKIAPAFVYAMGGRCKSSKCFVLLGHWRERVFAILLPNRLGAISFQTVDGGGQFRFACKRRPTGRGAPPPEIGRKKRKDFLKVRKTFRPGRTVRSASVSHLVLETSARRRASNLAFSGNATIVRRTGGGFWSRLKPGHHGSIRLI